MADNTTYTPGSTGITVATDDVAGVHYERVKLTDGTADSATPIVAGGGLEANALRVTVASDSTGVLSVDDNGGSLTVDAVSLPLPTGAATEATLDARTGALNETAPGTDTASSGLNGRLQRIAQRLTSLIALLPAALGGGGGLKTEGVGTAGTPAGGVVTVQGTVGAGGVKVYPLNATQFTDGLYPQLVQVTNIETLGSPVVSLTLANGPAGSGNNVLARTPSVFKPLSAVAINPEATIWAPAAGTKFRLMGGNIASSVAGNVTLRDNTAGTIIAVVPCGVAGVAYPIFGDDPGNGILSAAANNVLTATGPASSTLSGTVFGTQE